MSKPTLAEQIIDELRRAADKLTAEPHCGGKYSDCACDYAEQLAGLFRDLADNPTDVPASVVDMAVRINRAEVAKPASAPDETRIPQEQVADILEWLNAFGADEVATAIDWAIRQHDVAEADGPNAEGDAYVKLHDGTTIEWFPSAKQWAAAPSDECEAPEVSR